MAITYQNDFPNDLTKLNFCQLVYWDSLKLSFWEKNVLKLNYQGFSNYEIMKKLNLTYKQVDNAFQRVIKI